MYAYDETDPSNDSAIVLNSLNSGTRKIVMLNNNHKSKSRIEEKKFEIIEFKIRNVKKSFLVNRIKV